jgi:tRNA(adenine34) deaminase
VDEKTDDKFMDEALKEALRAGELGEVPVGAVVVSGWEIVGRGCNRRETDRDPLAHAEILAIREAARHLGRWRLIGCRMYVTLEPCPMCAAAVVASRLDRLIFGAYDPRTGAAGTMMDLVRHPHLNHRAEVTAGIRAEVSAALLRQFFSKRRNRPQ